MYTPQLDWDKIGNNVGNNATKLFHHLMVKQEVDEDWEFKFSDLFDVWFGFWTGALNTLPVDSDLYDCSQYMRQMQAYVTEMLYFEEQREIVLTIDRMSKVMLYINYTAVPCWRGGKTILFTDDL